MSGLFPIASNRKQLTSGTLSNQDLGKFFDLTSTITIPYIAKLIVTFLSNPSVAVEIIFKRGSEKGP